MEEQSNQTPSTEQSTAVASLVGLIALAFLAVSARLCVGLYAVIWPEREVVSLCVDVPTRSTSPNSRASLDLGPTNTTRGVRVIQPKQSDLLPEEPKPVPG